MSVKERELIWDLVDDLRKKIRPSVPPIEQTAMISQAIGYLVLLLPKENRWLSSASLRDSVYSLRWEVDKIRTDVADKGGDYEKGYLAAMDRFCSVFEKLLGVDADGKPLTHQ